MNPKVKSIEEFPGGNRLCRFVAFCDEFLIWGIVVVGGVTLGLTLVGAKYGLDTLATKALAAGVLLGILLLVAVFTNRVGRLLAAAQRSYEEYISSLPVATLVAACKSSVVSSYSRKVITEFLNEHHPGWSVGGAEGTDGRQAGA